MPKIFYILIFLLNLIVSAQTYPVQVVPVLHTPYSSKLSDYANPLANRMQLQIITTDLSVQNRSVTLHLEIKGNGLSVTSAPSLTGVAPLRINGGEILTLSHSQLANYFQLHNLQGITSEQYANVLSDGVYSFCFRVKDVLSGQWLSQNQCTIAYLMLNDPPILNIPSDNEQIQISDFQNIIFNWTPRQINATNVAYTFELREILDPNLDPKFAFEVSRKVHFEENLRTTSFVYDISKPNLIPGRRYAWRVKAISTSGLAENSVFKNNGFSEVRSFVYAVNCSKPAFLLSQQQSKASVKLLWQGTTSHQKYHIQYRKKGIENAQWFETFTRNTQTIIANLQDGAEYEFRVGASCESERYGIAQSFVYADIQTFSIEKQEKSTQNSYNCGIVPKIEITNQKPLGSLIANEVFTAGDFPVQVIEAQGSNGIFSGKGFIKVPYLNDTKLAVSFENIKINTDNQLVEGVVRTEYEPQWGNVVEVAVIQTINEAIEFLKNIFKKQKEIQQKQKDLDKKYAKKEISSEIYNQETENNNKNWNKLVEAQINTEQFIEKNPLLTSEEANELADLQKNSFLVSNKITSKDIENAKYRSEKTTEILENLEKRELEISKILIKLFECPDCDNNNLFFETLTKIARNFGRKKAEKFIQQWEDYYKTGVASTEPYTIEMTLNQSVEIYSKNEKFKKMFQKIQKGISVKGAASAMGFYNTYRYSDKISIQGKVIHYKGEIKIKDIEEFHIYAVEFPKSGKNTFDSSEDYQIRFLNKNNIVVCILFFYSEKDINSVWDYYYTKEMKKAEENTIKEYDYKHKTQYYKIFKR